MLTSFKKVAIVHDWLVAHRGGERVLDAFLELFPQADVYTLFSSRDSFQGNISKHVIVNSWMNSFPGIQRYYRAFLPLMPLAAESFDLRKYDLVISSSHCVAKGVITAPGSVHLCYCYTPARYVWDLQYEYLTRPVTRMLMAPLFHRFRQWDYLNSVRVDAFATSSQWVASRIGHYYRRQATIINPFVDLDRFELRYGDRRDFYLIVSALVPYKRIDLAIEACKTLKKKLVIIGTGPEFSRLKRLAGSETEFLGYRSDKEISELYAGAQALLFPGVEDFGIVPLEAMACGTPVIAYGAGGVLETVTNGETGILFEDQSKESMVDAILKFESRKPGIQPATCRKRAENFSRGAFIEKFTQFVELQAKNVRVKQGTVRENHPI